MVPSRLMRTTLPRFEAVLCAGSKRMRSPDVMNSVLSRPNTSGLPKWPRTMVFGSCLKITCASPLRGLGRDSLRETLAPLAGLPAVGSEQSERFGEGWLGRRDSNPNNRVQSAVSYR